MKKILIVDFEEESLKALVDFLKPRGFQVITAKDGKSGLRKFEQEKPDLVILDLLLPKMSGFALFNSILNDYERKVPVLVMTGSLNRIKSQNDGIEFHQAQDYFGKSYSKGELITVINELLGGKEAGKLSKDTDTVIKVVVKKDILYKGKVISKGMIPRHPGEAKSEKVVSAGNGRREEAESLKEHDLEEKKETLHEMEVDLLKSEGLEEETKEKKESIVPKVESRLGIDRTERTSELYEEITLKSDKTEQPKDSEHILKLGEYVLLEEIGSGGMGVVFKAKKKGVESFEKMLAIKRIHPRFVEENEKVIHMFIDEAKIAAQLSHPNIVHIYDLGNVEGYYFIAMEYVFGKDLNAVLNRLKKLKKRMPCDYACYIATKICKALDYSHKKVDASGRSLGIVHRDICPKNILLTYDGEVKLIDFGVAKATSKLHHTMPGAIKGKILYMSPEQALGEEVDYRADLFSLGSVLMEMVTGEEIFSEGNDIAILKKIQSREIILPSQKRSDIPKELERIILKARQYECDQRYQDALGFQKDLENFLKNKGIGTPTYRDISQFMITLFADELKKEGHTVQYAEELRTKLKGEKEPSKEEFLEKSEVTDSSYQDRDEKREKIHYKLLLADDSPVIQKVVKLALDKKNFKIYPISDSKEIVKSIDQIKPHLVLLDINLPKKSGYEICEYLKNERKFEDTGIILLKEAFEQIDKNRLNELKYDEIIQKPFDSKKFASKIEEVLEKKGNPKASQT